MKILHAAVSTTAAIGIVNQMQWEQQAAQRLNLDWDVALYTAAPHLGDSPILVSASSMQVKSGFISKLYSLFRLRLGYYRWLKSREKEYDILMLRYSTVDIFQPIFILTAKRPILLVHHTLEVPELMLEKDVIGRIAALIEKMLGRISLTLCAGIVGVTREIALYEKNRSGKSYLLEFIYPNGYVLEDKPLLDNRTDTPEILFVASLFSPWHGLDRLLSSLSSNSDQFVLHLVGSLLPGQIEMINNDRRIVVHGRLSLKEIETISQQCWLGLSSFALDRKSMNEACTLKVREYLANGLPVYAGYADVFPHNFKYFRNGPPDITEILSYAKELRSESRQAVNLASRQYVCKENLVKNLYEQICKSDLLPRV